MEDVKLGALYLERHRAICDLLDGAADLHAVPVPACEPWTAHELVSHLAGVCADVLAGNLEGVATDAWTEAQVSQRRTQPTVAVLEEWAGLARQFAAIVDAFPGWYRHQAVADITVHEHDLRGALNRPGDRQSHAVAVAADFLVATRAHPTAETLGIGPVAIEADGTRWLIGSMRPNGDDVAGAVDSIMLSGASPNPDGDPRASLQLSTFELMRALSGRRSADQIRHYDWDTEPGPFLPLFAAPPFAMRTVDLHE